MGLPHIKHLNPETLKAPQKRNRVEALLGCQHSQKPRRVAAVVVAGPLQKSYLMLGCVMGTYIFIFSLNVLPRRSDSVAAVICVVQGLDPKDEGLKTTFRRIQQMEPAK